MHSIMVSGTADLIHEFSTELITYACLNAYVYRDCALALGRSSGEGWKPSVI